MIPDELSQSSLSSALDGARIVYSDVRLHETALVIAQEVIYLLFSVFSWDFVPLLGVLLVGNGQMWLMTLLNLYPFDLWLQFMV